MSPHNDLRIIQLLSKWTGCNVGSNVHLQWGRGGWEDNVFLFQEPDFSTSVGEGGGKMEVDDIPHNSQLQWRGEGGKRQRFLPVTKNFPSWWAWAVHSSLLYNKRLPSSSSRKPIMIFYCFIKRIVIYSLWQLCCDICVRFQIPHFLPFHHQ